MRAVLRGQEGMIIPTIMMISGALLFLIYVSFNSAQRASQVANAGASSTELQEVLQAVRQDLATVTECASRLKVADPALLQGMVKVPKADPLPVEVLGPAGEIVLRAESPGSFSGIRSSSEFKILRVGLADVVPLGRTRQEKKDARGIVSTSTETALAALRIVAERRTRDQNGIKVGGFLGSREIVADVPIALTYVPGGAILECTTRTEHLIFVGPSPSPANIARKSGLECLDRGGKPILDESRKIYLCALPVLTAWQNCDWIQGIINGKTVLAHPEGWVCDSESADKTVVYAY